MRYQTLVAWGMALAIGMGVAANAQRAKFEKREGRTIKVVTITRDNDQDDSRAFQNWYGEQVRGYDGIDRETGEPYHQLLQFVTDINGGRLVLVDRQNDRHQVVVTKYTKISYEPATRSNEPPTVRRGRPLPADPDRASRVRPGDLVIVQGYLRANGQLAASQIRIIDHVWGWESGDEYDNDDDDAGYQGFDGYRAYGTVADISLLRSTVVIETNNGRKTIELNRGGEVIVQGNRGALTALRRGDRVVFYYTNQGFATLKTYRIVWLDDAQKFPNGNRPYWADPKYTNHAANEPVVEGRLESVFAGTYFNRIQVRSSEGRMISLRLMKGLPIYDEDGVKVTIEKLRDNESVRVYYLQMNDGMFARKIEVL